MQRWSPDADLASDGTHICLDPTDKLYEMEQQAKKDGLDAIALRDLRQERSKPILEEIRRLLDDWSVEVLPKSPIGRLLVTPVDSGSL